MEHAHFAWFFFYCSTLRYFKVGWDLKPKKYISLQQHLCLTLCWSRTFTKITFLTASWKPRGPKSYFVVVVLVVEVLPFTFFCLVLSCFDIFWYIWTYLDIVGHIWTYLDIVGHISTYFDTNRHIWTHFDMFELWIVIHNTRNFGNWQTLFI